MSHSIAIPQHQPVGYIKGRVRNLLLSAIAGSIIGTLGYAISLSAIGVARDAFAAQAAPAEPVMSFPAREIPPEWQWPPPTGNYNRMYRGVTPQRLEWIRPNGRR
jgi:hypothetical protein